VEVETFALDGDERMASHSGCYIPRKGAPEPVWTWQWCATILMELFQLL